MNTRVEKIKNHIKRNKLFYISNVVGFVSGAVMYLVLSLYFSIDERIFKMIRPTTNPQKRGRQERALLQRKHELQLWESGEINTDNVASWSPSQNHEDQKDKKIHICKEEIASLEKKLFL